MVKCPVSSMALEANGVITILRHTWKKKKGVGVITWRYTTGTAFFSGKTQPAFGNHQKGKWRNEDHELTVLLPSDLLITGITEPQARRQGGPLMQSIKVILLASCAPLGHRAEWKTVEKGSGGENKCIWQNILICKTEINITVVEWSEIINIKHLAQCLAHSF